MGVKNYQVIISARAQASFRDIIQYISKKSSPRIANKIRRGILDQISALQSYPRRFSYEPALTKEGEEIRSVSKWNIKIIYQVTENQVLVLVIIHTSRDLRKLSQEL